MKSVLAIAAIILTCTGCAQWQTPALFGGDKAAKAANYDYKGDLTRDGGSDCWYYCP